LNVQPAGEYLSEAYHRAGEVPAVVGELMQAGKIAEDALTVTGKSIGENCWTAHSQDTRVIRTYDRPLKENAGLLVVSGNVFESALVKTSVIGE
jgi:dihydroxy-acid dehydratase